MTADLLATTRFSSYYQADQLKGGVRARTLCSLEISLEKLTDYLDAEARGDRGALQASKWHKAHEKLVD